MKYWVMTNKRKLKIIPICLFILVTISLIAENYTKTSLNSSDAVAETEASSESRPVSLPNMDEIAYDDLVFYDSALEKIFSEILNTEKFDALPQGKVLLDQNDFLGAKIHGEEFGSIRQVDVENMPFTKARKITVFQLPTNTWDIQFTLPSITVGKDYEDEDIMLLLLYIRTLATENENGIGQIQFAIEQNDPPYDKALQVSVTTLEGEGWHKVYLPFESKEDYGYIRIRLGYDIQMVELGGFELINFGKNVNIEDLPTSSLMGAEWSVFTSEAQWRKDAWKRIEEIRKGEINVIVNDADGNPIENAVVDINMNEHEFQWGTVINESILLDNVDGDKYRQAISSLFNSAVTENSLKWNMYEANPANARKEIDAAKALNIKHFRGHTLMWDFDFPNGWKNNTAIPRDVFNLLSQNNKAGLNERIKEHILKTTSDFHGEITDWDVVNEPLDNNAIRSKYGNEILKDWFNWAREGDPNANLYINERNISGLNQPYLDNFKLVLDYMVKNDIDFDGIGIQSHFGNTMVHPMYFYDAIDQLAAFGKEIKITEFDLGAHVSELSREYEASFVRDVMIAAFSHESVTGFYMWGFWSGSHHAQNAPIFNADWTLKESGKQFIDLVYNHWFTQESGVTNIDGKYNTRGYYGDYDISVTVNKKVKVVKASFYKGQKDTILITVE